MTENGKSPAADFYAPEHVPPIGLSVALGAQHVLAMFGATVLGPLLMGFDPNTAIFFSGIATLLFFVIVRGKVPSYLGSSFAFIAAVGAATGYGGSGPNPNIAIALGGIIAAGAVYALIGLLVWWAGTKVIDKIFPPTVTGCVVAIIGLNLAGVGVQQLGTEAYGMAVGGFTLLMVVLAAVFAPGRLKLFPIIVGGGAGYALYWWLGREGLVTPIDFSGIYSAAWFGLPKFTAPVFDWTAITLIAPVAVILVAENLGHIKAIGEMTNQKLDKHMGRAFVADGLATMLSGAGGGTGVTTYAENMGVMSLTRNFASITFVFAALFAIGLGLSPKFGAVLATIPPPVLGGLSFILFGLITATAGIIWQRGRENGVTNFEDTRTLMVVGISLVMGAGDLTVRIGNFALGGIVTATLAAIILYHLLGVGRPKIVQTAG